MNPGLVVVGGSYAAVHIVAAAREHGWSEPIHLVTEEPWAPYERPPLSKSFVLDAKPPESLGLRGAAFYERHDIELVTGTRVVDIDHPGRTVHLSGGGRLPYRRLALATGAAARTLPLPGAGPRGVMTLRCLADALALRERLREVEDVVVLGAGFVGLELACALTATGRRVTVLEAADRVMARALTPLLSDWLRRTHQELGVRILTSTSAQALIGDGGKVRAVRTTSGELIPAGLVVVGVGASARTELAQRCGAATNGGVVVDAAMRTSVPDVVAAGDCTLHPNPYAVEPVRLESVQNATDQGRVAGATVAGVSAALTAVPWFWSDQGGVKLQMAGIRRAGLREVVRGSMSDGLFSLVYLDEQDKVVAIDSVNRPVDHLVGRRLVAARARIPAPVAADPSVDLKTSLVPAVPA